MFIFLLVYLGTINPNVQLKTVELLGRDLKYGNLFFINTFLESLIFLQWVVCVEL